MDYATLFEELQSGKYGRMRKIVMWLGILMVAFGLFAVLVIVIAVVIHSKVELGATDAIYGQLHTWASNVHLPVKTPALFGGGELKGDNLQFQTLVYLMFGLVFLFLLLNIRNLGPLPLVAFSLLTVCTDANVGQSAATLALFFGSFALVVFHQKGGVNWGEQIALSAGILAGYLIIAFVLVEPLGSVFYDLYPMNGLLRVIGYICFIGMQLFVGANKKLSSVAAIGAGSYIQFLWLGQGVNQWVPWTVKIPSFGSWAQVISMVQTPAFRDMLVGVLPWVIGSLVVIVCIVYEMTETAFAAEIWTFLRYFVLAPFAAVTMSEWCALHFGWNIGPLAYLLVINIVDTSSIVSFGTKGEGAGIKEDFNKVLTTFMSGLQRFTIKSLQVWFAPLPVACYVIVVLFLSPFVPRVLFLVGLWR